MKKLLLALAALPLLFITIHTAVNAQEENNDSDVIIQEAPENTEETPKNFTVYVREGCPHCAQVKAFVTRNGLEDNVIYIETYNNQKNATKLEEEFDKYNAPSSDQGVPFMPVDDSSYKVGDTPIINYLAEQFGLDNEIIPIDESAETTTNTNSGSDKAILFGGALVILAIVGYGIYTVLNKKDA